MKYKKISIDVETQQANLLKLVSHPVRIAILKILSYEEACVCHMEATLGYRQAYLSQQLAILRQAEIITDRRDGWNIYYQINNQTILEIINLAGVLIGSKNSQIPIKPVICPCPKCKNKIDKEACCDDTRKDSSYVNN